MKKKSSSHVKKKFKRIFVFGMISISCIIFILVSVSKIVIQIFDKYKEESELEEKLISLKEDENNLNNEINKLQDPDYLARYAREKYFYSKEGELIIRIPKINK